MVREMSAADARYVCQHMRWPEIAERQALAWGEWDADAYAAELAQRQGPAYVCTWQDRPVVVGGLQLTRPGVATTWMAGTDDWPHVVRVVTRYCRRAILAMLETEVHRIECLSAAWFTEAHRWYRLLGLELECVLRAYGRDGSDYHLYRRLRHVPGTGS